MSYFEWKTDKPSPEVHGGTWCGSQLRSLKEEASTSEPAFTAALLEARSTQYRLSTQLFHIYDIFSLQHKMVASARTILKSMLLSVQIPDWLEGANFLGIISISDISLVGSKQLFMCVALHTSRPHTCGGTEYIVFLLYYVPPSGVPRQRTPIVFNHNCGFRSGSLLRDSRWWHNATKGRWSQSFYALSLLCCRHLLHFSNQIAWKHHSFANLAWSQKLTQKHQTPDWVRVLVVHKGQNRTF